MLLVHLFVSLGSFLLNAITFIVHDNFKNFVIKCMESIHAANSNKFLGFMLREKTNQECSLHINCYRISKKGSYGLSNWMNLIIHCVTCEYATSIKLERKKARRRLFRRSGHNYCLKQYLPLKGKTNTSTQLRIKSNKALVCNSVVTIVNKWKLTQLSTVNIMVKWLQLHML